MQQVKFNSLRQLKTLINGEQKKPTEWARFLQEKGHDSQSFSYLPEDIKTSLRFSFSKRQLISKQN